MRLKLLYKQHLLRAAISEGETIPLMKSKHFLIDEDCIVGVVDITKCDMSDPHMAQAGTLKAFKLVNTHGYCEDYLNEYRATPEEYLALTHAMVESFNHLCTTPVDKLK